MSWFVGRLLRIMRNRSLAKIVRRCSIMGWFEDTLVRIVRNSRVDTIWRSVVPWREGLWAVS